MQQRGTVPVDLYPPVTPAVPSGTLLARWRRGWQRLGAIILWLEPFWLAVLAPSILLREHLWDPWVHPWLVGALLLFWPLRLLFTGRLMPATPLRRPLLLLLLWSPVGMWASTTPERSWEALGFLVFGVAIYGALVNWPPTQRWPWLAALALALLGCGLAFLGPALLLQVPDEFVAFSAEVEQSQPADLLGLGETVNPNILAGVLVPIVPLLLALLFEPKWSKQRWVPWLTLLLALPPLFALGVAQSRGGFLAVFAGVLTVIALQWPWAGLGVLLAVLAALGTLSWEGILLLFQELGGEGALGSLSGRVEVWKRALAALRDFPLTGIGIGTFDLVIPVYYPYPAGSGGSAVTHAHNLFLQVGVDLGLVGMALYGWLWVQLFGLLGRILRARGYLASDLPAMSELDGPLSRAERQKARQQRRAAALRRALATGAVGASVALLVHGLLDAPLWGTKLAFVPWLLFALVALLDQQGPNAEEGAEPPHHRARRRRRSRRPADWEIDSSPSAQTDRGQASAEFG
jgi:putative inorganic carbon (hco3(-)) transporter